MSMYKQFGTSADYEQKGIWLDYGPFRIKVARAGGRNHRFTGALDTLSRPFLRAFQTGTMDNKKADEILQEAYLQGVILGWEVRLETAQELGWEFEQATEDPETGQRWVAGIEGPDGEHLPFTKENVRKTLQALPDLWTALKGECDKMALFRQAALEEDAGNS